MPKKPRTDEKVEDVREKILMHALDLIVEHGYEGFSMRKVANKMGFAAKTIYNYFENKDEIYLRIVIKGYRQLYDMCIEARDKTDDPIEKLRLMALAYMDFGFGNKNHYNLMFTWHTPKYNDYVNTQMEPVAKEELIVSLSLYSLCLDAAKELIEPYVAPEKIESEASFYVIFYWSLLHGYIANYQTTLLSYIHHDPKSLRGRLLETLLTNMEKELKDIINKHENEGKYNV